MRVKVSKEARNDIRRQLDYLEGQTISGIVKFRSIIERAQHLLAGQPFAGRARGDDIPIQGSLRVIIDGWYFDYDVIEGAVWIQRITHSVVTPSLTYDDDFDYESDDSEA